MSVPSVVGSVAVLAAASGTLTMPSAGGGTLSNELLSAPERPEASEREASSLDTLAAASRSLQVESAKGMEAAHEATVEQQRREAAEREARRQREAQRWVAPLSSYRVSAGFGASGQWWSGTHTGLDLAASYGAEIRAVSSGEIVWAGFDGAYGNKIVIQHWDGTQVWYCHMSRILQRSGSVSPGEAIGAVGTTGNTTGPHLHLEVHPDGGGAVNPWPWFDERGVSL